MQNKLILTSVILFFNVVLWAQCPNEQWLWNRLIFLRDSATLSPQAQLKELMGYEKAVQNCPYKNDSTHALLLQRIGAAHYRQADYISAIQYAKAAIYVISTHASSNAINDNHIIKNYFNLSVFYDSLDNHDEHNRALDSCIAISIRLHAVDAYTLFALVQRVEYFMQVGDYERAYLYAGTGESLTAQYLHSADSIDYAINFFTQKINVLLSYKEYNTADKLLMAKIAVCKNNGAANRLAPIYSLLASVQLKKGRLDQASTYYNQALLYSYKTGNAVGCMQALNDLAYDLYYNQYKDYNKALFTLHKALTYNSNNSFPFEAINILTGIADVYMSKGAYDSAFHYLQQAFEQIGAGFNEILLSKNLYAVIEGSSNIYIQYLIGLLLKKGDAYLQQYKWNKNNNALLKAIQVYKTTDQVLDKAKAKHAETQSKLFWRNYTHRLYEHAIEASYYNHNPDDAFYFFEKSRAVLLNDQLREQQWFSQQNIAQQVQLKKKILQYERELADTATMPARAAQLQEQLIISKQQLASFLKTIEKNNPLYYQNFIDTSFITLKKVQDSMLRNQHTLVELFEGDSTVYALIITKEKSYLHSVDKKDFDSSISLYTTYLSSADMLNRKYDAFVTLSRHLYASIFRNVILPEGRIIISPEGSYFPFESLISNAANEKEVYLLTHHAISYTYSARYLLNQFNGAANRNTHDFLGVAPMQYPNSWQLAPLPESNNSLDHIKSYFNNPNILSASDATKNNFLSLFYNFKIIQLYTHASDGGNKGEPSIYFADSVLHLSDLLPEDKPATELIILSACETANGKSYPGEGIFSFNRGFAALGVPAAIANLWQVDNQATYEITELFYKHLSTGLPADVALQKAKLEFIQANSNSKKELPYYWAAAILVGKVSEPQSQSFAWWILYILLPLLAGLALWQWMIYKKRRKNIVV